ncbi:MAG: hypothetical protein WA917_00355 [Comamonas sp.]|nr:hypothetical protein [Comamonas sp.]
MPLNAPCDPRENEWSDKGEHAENSHAGQKVGKSASMDADATLLVGMVAQAAGQSRMGVAGLIGGSVAADPFFHGHDRDAGVREKARGATGLRTGGASHQPAQVY